MTSSFRGSQSTNYLSTEADLSGAVNKEIDANIKDTQAFYDQMVEIEKLRYQNRDDNLKALATFTQQASQIYQKIQTANEIREGITPYAEEVMTAQELLDAQERLEEEQKKIRNKQKQFGANAAADAATSNDQETKETASDAAYALRMGDFDYNEDRNGIQNLKKFSGNLPGILNSMAKDNRFAVLDNKIMNDNTTHEDAKAHSRQLRIIAMQGFLVQHRANGGKDFTLGQLRKYLGTALKTTDDNLINKWRVKRDSLLSEQAALQNREEISAMVQNPETMANDILGPDGWITSRKEELEAGDASSSFASLKAFEEFGDILVPMLQDPESGFDAAKARILLDTVFEFNGSKGTLDSKSAPKGAKTLFNRIRSAVLKYDDDAVEQDIENKKLEMSSWGDKEHKEFLATDPDFLQIKQYTLDFKKKFSIKEEEQLPDFMKNMIASTYYSDEQIIIDITGRRIKNLPITESMIKKIQDPDKRASQMQYVNTPELGAFTEEEAESMDERVVAIVKEAKQLRDLDKAKTDKYIVTRDNTKEYITARFKELVIGGQNRKTAMFNAISEAKELVKKGDFDKEQILPIDVQATKDLDSTLKAIGKDPSLIYSTEEWAGEAPHLAIAREYVRTKGRSKYPSYYMRFNFIKNSDGAYLTPEEIFETRVNKVDKKEAKVEEIPERKELDNVEDQNKLLNKNNSTKTLDVALKNNNMDWMIKSSPTFSEVNAEAFIRQLEINIQNQHSITGIAQTHRQKTTLSAEDSNKLLEAVPELKEAPFLNPNTLSTAAINEMLNLNI